MYQDIGKKDNKDECTFERYSITVLEKRPKCVLRAVTVSACLGFCLSVRQFFYIFSMISSHGESKMLPCVTFKTDLSIYNFTNSVTWFSFMASAPFALL